MSENEIPKKPFRSTELKPDCGPVFRNYDETPPNDGPPNKQIAEMAFRAVYADKLGPPKKP